ncbi:MAG: non-ribosomal peptide synthetase, partial [bacterium]|nr:non-ribosomal peptide synthetase [bacterium]
SKKLKKESAYWKEIESLEYNPLPRDFEAGEEEKKNKYSETVTVDFNPEETENLLKRTNTAYNTEVNDILLTALGLAIKEWRGLENVFVNLEGHGREPISEEIDISRTVGWFTSLYPVSLDMTRSDHLPTAVKGIKETLRGIPGRGIGYGILRYLTPDEKNEGYIFTLEPEISFNYLGQFGQEFLKQGYIQMSPKKTGDTVSPEAVRKYALDINGILVNGQLRLSFTYCSHEYRGDSIRMLCDFYKSFLL